MSRSRNPPSPLLIISSVLLLSAFKAATVFASIALASPAVPYLACSATAAPERKPPEHKSAIVVRVSAVRRFIVFPPLCLAEELRRAPTAAIHREPPRSPRAPRPD